MVGLRCRSVLLLRLSSRVLSRIDVRSPDCASLTRVGPDPSNRSECTQ